MHMSRRSVLAGGAATAAAFLANPLTARAATATGTLPKSGTVTVGAGQTLTVDATTRLTRLTIASGGAIGAPAGKSLTLTVNGVETGQKLVSTGATVTAVQPGTYQGDVWLTVTDENIITFTAPGPPGAPAGAGTDFPVRQALYVDADGVSAAKSVPSAVVGGKVTSAGAAGVGVTSTGEAFNAIFVAGGSYALSRPRIRLTGNGRSDFVGYGAAILGQGSATRLVVEGASVDNRGAVRTGVVVDDGASVVVKNSAIRVRDGVLPSDYVPTVDTTYMESAPWMLGISGNNRATNLLGNASKATYVASSITSEGWGALSTDSGQDCTLTAINCTVANSGSDGYGTYAIGNATENLLGCVFDVATYATINRGGAVHYGDSGRAAVAALNTSLGIGLTAKELAALPARNTVINSRRFGFMWHGAGTLAIDGGTVVNTREAVFLDKGQQVGVTVDGSGGVRLNPRNGIIFQVMEDDDPGPQMVNGKLENSGVYTEPATAAEKDASFDVTAAHGTDAVASFTDIAVTGDFFNGMRKGLNLVLTFTRSKVKGVITASTTRHNLSTIDSTQYREIGEVTNTPAPAVNNGVVVTLGPRSSWQVTGTSYLTSLTLAPDARLTGTLTVNGTKTKIVPGTTYTGALVLTK